MPSYKDQDLDSTVQRLAGWFLQGLLGLLATPFLLVIALASGVGLAVVGITHLIEPWTRPFWHVFTPRPLIVMPRLDHGSRKI